ncbi:MAG TPA: Fur family transcriptional regulator [Anaerolineales bacterium]
MSCASEYAPQLRASGFRMTSQRMAILHVLRHAGIHLSPSEVYRQARQDLPGLTEPTVYRTLEFLAHNGLARPAYTGSGHLVYEIAGSNHHHIVCRICGDEIEVEHVLLESLYRKLESTSGYLRIDSHMTFFGICPSCQKAD